MVVLNKVLALYQTSFCLVLLRQHVLVLSATWAVSPAGRKARLHHQGYFVSAELSVMLGQESSSTVPPNSSTSQRPNARHRNTFSPHGAQPANVQETGTLHPKRLINDEGGKSSTQKHGNPRIKSLKHAAFTPSCRETPRDPQSVSSLGWLRYLHPCPVVRACSHILLFHCLHRLFLVLMASAPSESFRAI